MAQPPLKLPAHGPWVPPVLRLLQPLVLPQTFCPPGSAPLCPLPGQDQPFPTAWAPPSPPAGLQRAPCGCCFDPRVFCVQWTLPYNPQGAAVAPVLPTPIPGSWPLEGHLAHPSIPSAAGTPPGSRGPPSGWAAPHDRAAGDPANHLAVPDKVLLEDALKLFGCSVDTEGLSREDPSSVPRPGESGDAAAAVARLDLQSLALPQDLLTPDYSVPEARAAALSVAEFYILGMEPPELWDAAMEPPPAQAPAEQRGHKRGQSPPASTGGGIRPREGGWGVWGEATLY